jgi:undecaprenyl-diphosphatase
VLRTFVLGIVQGLTEFLPISSSAHLSIVPKLLGYRTPELAFDVLLHFGTLAAVLVYFAKDLWGFVLSLVAPARLGARQAQLRRRLLGLLIVASVPAAIFGYLLQDWADAQTSRPLRSAVWLLLTTAILIAAELYARNNPPAAPARASTPASPARSTPQPVGAFEPYQPQPFQVEAAQPPTQAQAQPGAEGQRVTAARATRAAIHHGRRATAAAQPGDAEAELERLPLGKAIGIGAAQALALIPGTSRSGVTISAGLFEGISREAAARFSFLLSIPAILGAGVLKLGDLSQATETGPQLLVGFLAAAVSGFLAVSFLIRMLRTRTLWPFIWYRLIAGGLFVLLLATVRR